METCSSCGSELSSVADKCNTCGEPAEKPNVRLAKRAEEITALDERFESAKESAQARGIGLIADDFISALQRTVAVINDDIYRVRELVTKDAYLYINYYRAVRASTRKAATFERDRERRAVDSLLFGEIAEQIIFAALSLECRGLDSYGPVCIQLRDIAVAKRATVLEENSFFFVRRHNVQGSEPVPKGFHATWPERYKLAAAKLLNRLTASTTGADYQSILLASTGNRETDDFVEVHIYGEFDNKAVECVSSPKPTDIAEAAVWNVIKEILHQKGKVVEEY